MNDHAHTRTCETHAHARTRHTGLVGTLVEQLARIASFYPVEKIDRIKATLAGSPNEPRAAPTTHTVMSQRCPFSQGARC